MQLFHHFSRRTVSLLILSGFFANPALARLTTVTGTADMVYDFSNRSYKQLSADPSGKVGDKQKVGVGPEISVVSQGINDAFSLLYAPLLNYDFVTDSSGVDHKLNLKGERNLSRYWTLTVTDDYIRSDDPSLTSTSSASSYSAGVNGQQPIIPGNELSRDLSGQKYWTNTAAIRTAYSLAENSRIGGGYNYSVLRNDQGSTGYQDYDKHAFSTDFSYGFTQNWRSNMGLNYTRGLYDINSSSSLPGGSASSPNLHEYGANFGVDYVDSVKDFFPLKYSFNDTQYDGNTRPDNETHQWSAGWDHSFDARSKLAMGGGPSYAKTHGQDGTWGYNAYLNYTKKYEHASYALLFDKGYQTQNFTGTDASGLTDTYNAKANFTYEYTQSLGLDLFGRYSWQSTLNPQGQYQTAVPAGSTSYDKNIYEAGTGFNYTFAQWYKAGVKYTYYVSDGKLASDQYTDHQILCTLTASKELWRW